MLDMMDLWRRIEAFFDILFTRNVMAEVAAVTAALWVGWAAGRAMRSRFRRRAVPASAAMNGAYLATEALIVVTPSVS